MVEREFDSPVIQIDFQTNLPWVLDSKIPEELPME